MQSVPHEIKERIRHDILNNEKGVLSVAVRDDYIEVIVSPSYPIPSPRQVLVDGFAIPIRYVRGKVYSLTSMQLLPYMMAYAGQVPSCRTCQAETLMGGISMGHYRITAGTLGTFVYRNEDNRWAILTNNHVGANVNDSVIGDDWVQPGNSDGNVRVVAKLDRSINIKFLNNVNDTVYPGNNNVVDACIGLPLPEVLKTRNILEMGFPLGVKDTFVGMQVKKSGRTTGTNTGTIKSTDVAIKVNYGTDIAPKYAAFDDVLEVSPMIMPGDSGSLLLSADGYAVGLVFAGSFREEGETLVPIAGYACRIRTVLQMLNCSMLRGAREYNPLGEFVPNLLTGLLAGGAGGIVL